ncbi:NAD-dependent epimerase/dehydratase family protein [Vibrio splendidus]
MNNMKFLVTGGSGFIGTNVIDFLLGQGGKVVSIDIVPPANSNHIGLFQECDIRNVELLKSTIEIEQPDYVIHLAARTDLDGKVIDDYTSNTVGVESLCQVCSSSVSIKKILFASSMLVCSAGYIPESIHETCPTTPYGHSKAIGETIVRDFAPQLPDFVIVRPTSIWGPWFNEPYKNFFNMVLNQSFVDAGPRLAKKTYGYIDNVCGQIVSLVTTQDNLRNKLVYLGDDEPLAIRRWAFDIAAVSGKRPPLRVPYGLIKCAALAGDLLSVLGVRFPMTSFRLTNMTTNNILDCSIATKLNKYPVTDYNAANRRTVEWLNRKGR